MVLCGLVLFLDGYDIAAAGYAIPSLVDSWGVAPQAFTRTLAAGNFGLLLGSLGAGLLGDSLGRKPGLGGGIPVAIALAADFAPEMAPGRLVMLTSVGVPIGFAVGGLLTTQLVRIFGWPAIFVAGGVGPLAMTRCSRFGCQNLCRGQSRRRASLSPRFSVTDVHRPHCFCGRSICSACSGGGRIEAQVALRLSVRRLLPSIPRDDLGLHDEKTFAAAYSP